MRSLEWDSWHDRIHTFVIRDMRDRSLSLHHVRTQWENDCLQVRKSPHWKPGTTKNLILDFADSRTVRNVFLLFQPSVYDILLWQPEKTQTICYGNLFFIFFKVSNQTRKILNNLSLSQIFWDQCLDSPFYYINKFAISIHISIPYERINAQQ